MSWCGEEDLFDFADGPSSCFCHSVLLPTLDAVFLLWMLVHSWKLLRLESYIECNPSERFFLAAAIIVQGLLFVGLGLTNVITPALVLYVSLQFLVWELFAYVIYLESTRLHLYPSGVGVAFIILSFVFNAVTVVVNYQDHHGVDTLLENVMMILINAVLFVYCLWYSWVHVDDDDEQKRAIRYYSQDFNRNNPLRSNSETPFNIESSESSTCFSSVFGSRSPLDRPLLSKSGAMGLSGKSRSLHSIPPVQSVLERNLMNDTKRFGKYQPVEGMKTPSMVDTILKFFNLKDDEQSNSGNMSLREVRELSSDDEALYSYSFDCPGDKSRSSFTDLNRQISTDRSSLGLSTALMNVLDQHQAKVASSNPITEPGGRASNTFNRSSEGRGDLLVPTSPSKGDSLGTSSDCQVSVKRWATKELSEENGKASSSNHNKNRTTKNSGGSSSAQTDSGLETDNSSTGSGKDYRISRHIITELEFEIAVQISTSFQNGVMLRYSDASRSSRIDSKDGFGSSKADRQWSVWRTSNEVMVLHAHLVSSFLDLIRDSSTNYSSFYYNCIYINLG